MTAYKMNMVEYLKYAVTYEDKPVGTIAMNGEGQPMFHYESDDGTVKGSSPEIAPALRALKAWYELREV